MSQVKDKLVDLEDLAVVNTDLQGKVGNIIEYDKTALLKDITEPNNKNLYDQRRIPVDWPKWSKDENGGYSGAIKDAGNLIIYDNFQEETRYYIRFQAYNENASGKTGNGLAVRIYYTDETTSVATLSRATAEYTDFSGRSNTGKTIERIRISYSNGGDDIWHIRNVMIGRADTVQPYEEYVPNTHDRRFRDLFVTPQMFGAIGDGVADDSDAIQAALDSGHRVVIPFSKGQSYLVTKQLDVTVPYQQIIGDHGYGNVFSENYGGKIKFKRDDNTLNGPILFRIKTHDIKIAGINATWIPIDNPSTVRKAYGIFAYVKTTSADDESRVLADSDFTVENCNIMKFSWAVYFYGRGLTFKNNLVPHCTHGFYLYWENEYGTMPTENDILEHRAFIITGNRFHVQRNYLIYLRGGYANGLIFSENVLDMGRARVFLIDSSQANPQYWTIANNIFNEMIDTVISVESGSVMRHCRIENNLFDAVKGRWTGRASDDIRPNAFIKLNHSVGCTILGNTFSGSKQSPILLGDADKITIVGNSNLRYLVDNGTGEIIDDEEPEEEIEENDGMIAVTGTISNSVINSNNSSPSEHFICGIGEGTPTVSNSVIYGNLHGSGTFADKVTLTNVRSDEI